MANVFDIHIQALDPSEQADSFKFMSFRYNPTIGVKGFQLLINLWLKCLLTAKGSDPTDLSYGSTFAFLIGSSIPLSDAQDAVILAIESVNQQITALQVNESTYTPSERLASAELIDFTEDPAAPGFSAFVEIKNQAAERLLLNIPVVESST